MCGIAGVMNADLSADELRATLTRMAESLIHRGPDEGAVLPLPEHRSGLAARRLSIVDLENGRQPMANEDETVLAVLNGEIYNHVGLRRELIARGHRFRSRSDTEVIVHLYEEYGVNCLDHLRGMFGLAVFDTRRGRLLIARDGAGMKPLYFAQTPRGFVIGSEARALFASGLIRPEPNPAAIDTFLALGFVPAPLTMFRGIEKLRAGHYAVLDSTGLRRGVFWRYQYQEPGLARSDEDYADELESILRDSVRTHLAADVPVGAFLSGGWDSSLTTTFAAQQLGRRLQTFSIVFPDAPAADESRFSRQMAGLLGTEHHEIEFRNSQIPDQLPAIVRHLEEPCSAVPTALIFLLASLASTHLKTVISGEGADELFGGYHRFRRDLPYRVRQFVPSALARLAAPWFPGGRIRMGLNILGAPEDRIADTETFRIFSPAEQNGLLREDFRHAGLDVAPVLVDQEIVATSPDILARRLALDFTGRLADGILFMGDKMSMAHSLEIRMPFLDRSVIDFALRLPSRLKVNQGREKIILSHLARRHLPPEIAARRKKGLDYPSSMWVTPPVGDYARELLFDSLSGGPFNRGYVEQNLAGWFDPKAPRPGSISRVVALQLWWNEFITPADAAVA